MCAKNILNILIEFLILSMLLYIFQIVKISVSDKTGKIEYTDKNIFSSMEFS